MYLCDLKHSCKSQHTYFTNGLYCDTSRISCAGAYHRHRHISVHRTVSPDNHQVRILFRDTMLVVVAVSVILSLIVDDVLGSTLLGVLGFSSFWTIMEIFEQQERVRKGWFPRNPNRKYPWDDTEK